MAYTPPPEMQRVIDITRAHNRRLFERADQSLDELLTDAKEQEIHVSSGYEDRETGMWRVYLRYKGNDRAAESGYGADLAEALFHALRRCRAAGYADRALPPRKPGEPPLAHKSDAKKSLYNSPGLDEMPDEDPPWSGDAGAPIDDDEFDEHEGDDSEEAASGGKYTAEDVI